MIRSHALAVCVALGLAHGWFDLQPLGVVHEHPNGVTVGLAHGSAHPCATGFGMDQSNKRRRQSVERCNVR